VINENSLFVSIESSFIARKRSHTNIMFSIVGDIFDIHNVLELALLPLRWD
jgi:hypothetical protein